MPTLKQKKIIIEGITLWAGEFLLIETSHMSHFDKKDPESSKFTKRYYKVICGPRGGLIIEGDK